MQPQTRYALSGDVNIAYQVIGDGPIDLVFVMGWVSNIDEFWTEPSFANFLQRLARFSRLIVFDKRGTGLSDRVDENNLPTLEQRMDDVRAVMDAAGSRAALLGISEGGPMCILFAATYPERTAALMTFGSFARPLAAPDYPWGRNEEAQRRFLEAIRTGWGSQPVGIEDRIPVPGARRALPPVVDALPRAQRKPERGAGARADERADRRARRAAGDPRPDADHASLGRSCARRGRQPLHGAADPGCSLHRYPGEDHLPWTSDPEPVLGDIERSSPGRGMRPTSTACSPP